MRNRKFGLARIWFAYQLVASLRDYRLNRGNSHGFNQASWRCRNSGTRYGWLGLDCVEVGAGLEPIGHPVEFREYSPTW